MTTDLPAYGELMLPVLKAVHTLGGSGTGREISATVVEAEGGWLSLGVADPAPTRLPRKGPPGPITPMVLSSPVTDLPAVTLFGVPMKC